MTTAIKTKLETINLVRDQKKAAFRAFMNDKTPENKGAYLALRKLNLDLVKAL